MKNSVNMLYSHIVNVLLIYSILLIGQKLFIHEVKRQILNYCIYEILSAEAWQYWRLGVHFPPYFFTKSKDKNII